MEDPVGIPPVNVFSAGPWHIRQTAPGQPHDPAGDLPNVGMQLSWQAGSTGKIRPSSEADVPDHEVLQL
jgi:hypothetical protein